jgi:flagellar hook-associated protein 1 FlgK
MAIDSMMAAALSGLQTSQTALTTVSNNITNVNTPGYVREVVQQSPEVAAGVAAGVTIDDVQRVTNQFLENASRQATAASGSAAAIANLLNQAQAAFGDPSQAGAYLNQLSTVFSDFSAAANDPASSLPRSQVVDDLTSFLDSTQNVASTLGGLNTQADSQLSSDVGQVNQLLTQIAALNTNISSSGGTGIDISGLQDSQSQLIDQLSKLMTVSVATNADGSVVLRSSDGQLLVGFGDVGSLSYTPSVSGMGVVSITPGGSSTANTLQVGDGELQGLLNLRNNIIPGIQAQLSTFVSGAATTINAAHNANTAVPPPQTLTGRNTGLDLPTIVGDFTGTTNIAIVGANGDLTQQVGIDFTNDTLTVNGVAAGGFTPATFLASLNGALGGAGAATFSNGALSISASAAGSGVAISDDPTTPSQDGGEGFSQFFGLNDLISSNQITNFNTGLKATDNNGFTPGGIITFQIGSSTGSPIGNVAFTVPAGQPTMQDLITALNANTGGLGQFGSFSLSSAGALVFTPTTPGATLSVTSDNTQRGAGGPSMTQLFGLGLAQQASVATAFQVRPDIAANPNNMALAQLDLAAAADTPPQPVVAIGDGSGGVALAKSANTQLSFAAAGNLPAMTTTITQYAANLGGDLGQRSSAADSADTAANALQSEAQTRLQSVEGVNLDQELVNLSTFQQAYSASARLIQASQNMVQTLLNMIP